MSAIYFHAEHEEAVRIDNAERVRFELLCGDMLIAAIGRIWDTPAAPSWLREMLPAGHHLRSPLVSRRFADAAEAALRVGYLQLHTQAMDERLDVFTLGLNTALAVGGDALRLAARLHGQCEIHAWVDGPNRAWLADIIEEGLRSGVYRSGYNWETLAARLRFRADQPIVTSYSVTDSFPPWDAAGDKPKTWEEGMAWLRQEGGGLELRPDTWRRFYFGSHPVTGFHLERLALGLLTLAEIDAAFESRSW